MQACIKVIPTKAIGVGTQTVTGVQDKDGNNFVGKFFMFFSIGHAVNDLSYQGHFSQNAVEWNIGIDTTTQSGSMSGADRTQFSTLKQASTAQSTNSSILGLWSDAFFGGVIYRKAYVSAVSSGQFDITYTQNDATSDDLIAVILGGSDLDITYNADISNETVTTTTTPHGVFCQRAPFISTSAGTNGTVATGGNDLNFGWDTLAGTPGSAAIFVPLDAENHRRQETDRMYLVNGSAAAPSVTTWGPTSYTITGGSPTLSGYQIAFSGASTTSNSGSFNQSATTGSQVIDLGVPKPRFVMLLSTGRVTTSGDDNTKAEMSFAWVTPTSQVGFWTAETTVHGAAVGARIVSDSTALRFGTPNGGSTTFNSVASVTSLAEDGNLTLNWTSVDGTAREILFFVIGDAPNAANLTVIKEVSVGNGEAVSFDIAAGGGLSPTTLSLADGESYTFGGVAAGSGYSIIETPPENWIVTYNVSNGSPNTNITMAGEDVTVTVTNAYVGPRSRLNKWGLYQFNVKIRKEQGA